MRLALAPILAAGLVLATLLTIHLLPQLVSVLLLVFAGVVLGVLLDALTTRLHRVLPGGRWVAYGAMLLCVALVLAGIGMLVGPQLAREVPQLVQRIPEAWDSLLAQLSDYAVMESVVEKAEQPFRWFSRHAEVMSLVGSTFGALFNLFVIVLVGVYAAAAPDRYLHVGRYLLPAQKRERAGLLSGDLGRELRRWMLGRSTSMAVVGVATGVGLWLLDIPLAFTLGLLAGALSFVPYIGPILGLMPALLIAAVESLTLAGWVLLLYAVVQIVESMLPTPLIQQQAIALPPVILIAAQLMAGILVGPLGVLLAAPLVVCSVVTARWYQETSTQDASVE